MPNALSVSECLSLRRKTCTDVNDLKRKQLSTKESVFLKVTKHLSALSTDCIGIENSQSKILALSKPNKEKITVFGPKETRKQFTQIQNVSEMVFVLSDFEKEYHEIINI